MQKNTPIAHNARSTNPIQINTKSPLSEKFSLVLPLLEQRILPKKLGDGFLAEQSGRSLKFPSYVASV